MTIEGTMHFRLTYEGPLLSTNGGRSVAKRSPHVHDIRRKFHLQLKSLWNKHPVLHGYVKSGVDGPVKPMESLGFTWRPLVTGYSGLICELDILMLRDGRPGRIVADIDNRLKTLFDALRMPATPDEIGASTPAGQFRPQSEETPFFVLLENDDLITSVKVTTDTLLEDLTDPTIQQEHAVRLVIHAAIHAYRTSVDNLDFGV